MAEDDDTFMPQTGSISRVWTLVMMSSSLAIVKCCLAAFVVNNDDESWLERCAGQNAMNSIIAAFNQTLISFIFWFAQFIFSIKPMFKVIATGTSRFHKVFISQCFNQQSVWGEGRRFGINYHDIPIIPSRLPVIMKKMTMINKIAKTTDGL